MSKCVQSPHPRAFLPGPLFLFLHTNLLVLRVAFPSLPFDLCVGRFAFLSPGELPALWHERAMDALFLKVGGEAQPRCIASQEQWKPGPAEGRPIINPQHPPSIVSSPLRAAN